MNVWRHLFLDGEFAPRERILKGIGSGKAGVRPVGAVHSIYEELWHAARWQHIVLYRDEAAYARWREGGQFPPAPAPEDEGVWRELVQKFLADSGRAVQLAQDETGLATELDPGFTWRNALESLALHNAYHLGKIVLLRQLLGIWPAKDHAAA